MEMNILFTAFKGKNNSSAILLDKITGDKLYLTNSYVGLAKEINHLEQIYDMLQKNFRNVLFIHIPTLKNLGQDLFTELLGFTEIIKLV